MSIPMLDADTGHFMVHYSGKSLKARCATLQVTFAADYRY
jgi:hypothetical protein